MTITHTTLFRGASVAAIAAGLIFIGVQISHPLPRRNLDHHHRRDDP